VKKLLLENVSTGKETVLVSDGEKYIDGAFIGGINAELKAAGKEGLLSLGKTPGIKSGFLLEEGGLTVDCSFGMVIKSLRESTETQVANILFG
jgi:hypothetical protein